MNIQQVNDKRLIKDFLSVPKVLYRKDPVWVCPLDNDIENVFNPLTNNFHKHGKAARWIARDNKGVLIGRIAAFINEKKAYSYPQATGGIGFFEAVHDQAVANSLFDTAAAWLKENGMEAMDGPINFGENDTFWGLLTEGYTHPSYGMNYNFPYYRELFEAYGFKPLYEQLTNHIDLRKPFPDRFRRIAHWVIRKPGYSFQHFEKNSLNKYAMDFMEIYNDAWQGFENFVPINKETITETFDKMKAIMDEKLIWFAYINNEPASFVIILPDANQIIKPFKGKLGLVEKLRFVYRRWKGVSRMRAVVMGTKKKFQRHGLESALFIKLEEYVIPKNQYTELELSWVGDFNTEMLSIHQATGATLGKKHITYRKLFDVV